jgi:hypothetical protein
MVLGSTGYSGCRISGLAERCDQRIDLLVRVFGAQQARRPPSPEWRGMRDRPVRLKQVETAGHQKWTDRINVVEAANIAPD